MAENKKHTNALIHERSPYLLQHAHNPVDWLPWGSEALERAKKEDTPLLISIGYAACHWCHVMEHRCFEDEAVAKIMNDKFIPIKIDREERPDIDQIYMDALQMMTGSGGWPLNILALPDGRPFWGATYVDKEHWMKVLLQLSDLYHDEPVKVMGYAENMARGLQEINRIAPVEGPRKATLDLKAILGQWRQSFDTFLGGYKRAPKFMMPVNLEFFLYYAHSIADQELLEYVQTSLRRMAWGGIYDPVGGGFSRYSVDTKWHVPHFEKMAYDNAQLISLYAKAYAKFNDPLFKETALGCIRFLKTELMDAKGGFYSALDADSLDREGKLKEGAYYVWRMDALKTLLKEDYPLFADYFNINAYGHWEEGNYVLIRDDNMTDILEKYQLDAATLKSKIHRCLAVLRIARGKRPRPRLDDKILTSWNGLVLKGLTDAYRYLGDQDALKMAQNLVGFITTSLFDAKEGRLYHTEDMKRPINGFLEDYAAVIDGLIGLYEVSFSEDYLNKALVLTDYALAQFYSKDDGLFYFTATDDAPLIRRTVDVADNVIPASNSMMAHNLNKLDRYFPERKFGDIVAGMLATLRDAILKNPQQHAHWLHLQLHAQGTFHEIAIVGPHATSYARKIGSRYLPNTILAVAPEQSQLALLKHRGTGSTTQIHICEKGQCALPTEKLEDALATLSP